MGLSDTTELCPSSASTFGIKATLSSPCGLHRPGQPCPSLTCSPSCGLSLAAAALPFCPGGPCPRSSPVAPLESVPISGQSDSLHPNHLDRPPGLPFSQVLTKISSLENSSPRVVSSLRGGILSYSPVYPLAPNLTTEQELKRSVKE